MEKVIPLSVPNLKGNELKYVSTAVETEWVSTVGSYVAEFEKCIAAFVRVERAVACQSGTAGLHVALLVCGVNRDDIVLVPTLSFIATVNPVRYIGATPIFIDCDDSLCMDPKKLQLFCEEECELRNGALHHLKSGKRVSAIIPAHIFGNLADMESIMDIAEHYGLYVIEDAAEALGTCYTSGKFNGKYAGTIGDVGVFSFNGNKIITTGGGGMIVSRHTEMLEHAKHLTTQAKSDELHYMHDEVGYNYRLTNLQAALGVAQMEQLEDFISIKNENYARYFAGLAELETVKLLGFRENIRSNRWFYSVYCKDNAPLARDELIVELSKRHIQSRPIWGLIHQQIPYKQCIAYKIEKAYDYWEHVVNIPCSINLTHEDIDTVIYWINKLMIGSRHGS